MMPASGYLEGDGPWCMHGVPEDERCARCEVDEPSEKPE
jgi:hypothetical protein